MSTFLLRRLLLALLTLWFVTFLVYGLVRNMPGDPLLVEQERSDPGRKLRSSDLEAMRKAFELDKPWYQGYWRWLGRVLTFDPGNSISRKRPVNEVIGERIGPTLAISGTSLVMAYLLAIPLGLFAAARDGRREERALSLGLYMLYSLPSFVGALYLQILFHVRLGWLPLAGMTSDNYPDLTTFGKAWDIFQHALLPVTCLTYVSLAYYSRFIRSNMHEVLRQDYIRTARAKGVGRRSIIMHHAFRNTLIPLVTMIGLSLPGLLSGAVILEQVFNWPGIGRLFFEVIRERDYPTIMGLVLLFSTLTLFGQLLADVLYAVVDPRVTYS